MISTRLLLATVALASLGTACTAIVIGKVGGTGDYETVPLGGSTKSALDECALLKEDYAGEQDANACSTCIETSCKTDVEFACNRGQSQKKPWFSKLKDCAQRPWVDGYEPDGLGSGFYQCTEYRDAAAPISDNGSDTEREITAHNCVTNNCLLGDLPACKQCEVSIEKSSKTNEPPARLQDDPCGRCLVERCQPTIVKCCGTAPLSDFVKKCAFTADPANKATCLELGKTQPDAGHTGGYSDGGSSTICLGEIAACFRANCTGGSDYPNCSP